MAAVEEVVPPARNTITTTLMMNAMKETQGRAPQNSKMTISQCIEHFHASGKFKQTQQARALMLKTWGLPGTQKSSKKKVERGLHFVSLLVSDDQYKKLESIPDKCGELKQVAREIEVDVMEKYETLFELKKSSSSRFTSSVEAIGGKI